MRTLDVIIMRKGILVTTGLLITLVLNTLSQNNISVNKIAPVDTLKLIVQYTDCGEWGGHREFLKIFMSDKLKIEYSKDTVSCEYDNPDHVRQLLMSETRRVRNSERKLIDEYIKKVIKRSKEKRYACSNAANVFSITTKYTTVSFGDSCTNWDEFKVLVREIFK